jgi:hypothetical protein
MALVRRAGLSLMATLALGAIVVGTASAAEIAEWLASGSEIGSPLKAKSETVTALRLEDSKMGVEVEIASKGTGTVGPTEKDLVELLTVTSVKTVAGACESPVAVPVNLPWRTELFLSGATFRDRTIEAGWLIECTVFGIKTVDTCTGNFTAAAINIAESKDVDTETDAVTAAEAGNCTVGGAGASLILAGNVTLVSAEAPETALAVSAAAGPPPAARDEYTDFTGGNAAVLVDHEKNISEKALAITEFGVADAVDWRSPKAGEITKNWPVAYARTEKIKLEVRFALEAETQKFLEEKLEGEVTFSGELTLGATKLTFTKKLTMAQVTAQLTAHKTYLTTETVESNVAVPEEVRLFEGASLAWKWTLKEKGRANAFEQAIGTSTHNVYVTYKKALATTETYLTLLDLDSAGVKSETLPPSEAKTLAGVWRGFKNVVGGVPTIKIVIYNPATGVIDRATGFVLKYYANVVANQTLKALAEGGEAGRCEVTAGVALLEGGESQCWAWAELLGMALATEGVASKGKRVWPVFGAVGKPCATLGNCIFLVKNWKFAAGGGSKPGTEFPYTSAEVTDEEGIAGQGIKNPSAWFANHVIIEAEAKLYDPSYGTGPIEGAEQLNKYQEGAIAGFCAGVSPNYECQQAPMALQLTEEEVFKF